MGFSVIFDLIWERNIDERGGLEGGWPWSSACGVRDIGPQSKTGCTLDHRHRWANALSVCTPQAGGLAYRALSAAGLALVSEDHRQISAG